MTLLLFQIENTKMASVPSDPTTALALKYIKLFERVEELEGLLRMRDDEVRAERDANRVLLADVRDRDLRIERLTARVVEVTAKQDKVKTNNLVVTQNFGGLHRHMDEVDHKVINSPYYHCLRLDMMDNSRQKRVQLTQFGQREVSEKGKGEVGCTKQRKSDGAQVQELVVQLETAISKCINPYFTLPDQAIPSKNGAKNAKKVIDNYTVKTSRGYMQGGEGSREKFQQVLNSFHTLRDSNVRPAGEKLFNQVKGKLDSVGV